MKNITAKIFILLSSALALGLGMLGFKMQKDESDIRQLKALADLQAENSRKILEVLEKQQQIQASNQAKLDKVANSEIGKKTVTSTQTTVIPGKTVKQTTTVPASQSTTRSS